MEFIETSDDENSSELIRRSESESPNYTLNFHEILSHVTTDFVTTIFQTDQVFEARISNIYDLSKFWIVKKFNELKAFDTYVFRFYYKNHNDYKIPENKIKVGLYCVAFSSGGYYRGKIISCTSLFDSMEKYVKIFFLDYGMVESVHIKYVYYMLDSFYSIPQFAIRSCLAKICPVNKPTWSSDDITKFGEMVNDKIVHVLIGNIDMKHQVLDVFIKLPKSTNTIQKTLISEGVAQHVQNAGKLCDIESGDRIVPRIRYPYLFPSHAMIESGVVPSFVIQTEYLKPYLCKKKPFSQYYKIANKN